MEFKSDNKGVSLALSIGLLLLLVTITTTVNELVIRALRSSHQIEASDKAYFAAEAGVEDALYELSAHTAGYETADLAEPEVRHADFTENVSWTNKWELKNKALNICDNSLASWVEIGFNPTYCGRIYEGSKLVINLFTDDALSTGVLSNQISEAAQNINKLSLSALKIVFRLPPDVVADNLSVFSGTLPLAIDNDGDYDMGSGSGLNEDGPAPFFSKQTCPYSGLAQVDDNDCDGRADEDSEHDPVILWKLIDDKGNSFQPLRGCKTDPQHTSHSTAGDSNATLCEKDFILTNNELSVSLTEADRGVNQNGVISDLAAFIAGIPATNELQMELLLVAPMQAVDAANRLKVPIPYLEYGMTYDAADSILPSTYFSIKSDGYYKDFKQSITTNVVPRATTRLLDLTIIQQ